jgi:hypothetical protein
LIELIIDILKVDADNYCIEFRKKTGNPVDFIKYYQLIKAEIISDEDSQ